jgi:hypothetical protein
VSEPDQQLSDRLKAAGYAIGPRQLERWRVDGGVVERSGSTRAFAQARQVRQLLDDGLDLEQIAIVQFMRGRYVRTPALKRALRAGLAGALGAAPPARDWIEGRRQARLSAQRKVNQLRREPETKSVRREIQRSAGRKGERVNEATERVLGTMYMVAQFGEPPTRPDLAELLAALDIPLTGLRARAVDVDATAEQLRDTMGSDPRTNQQRLEAVLERASRRALEQARRDYGVFAVWRAKFRYTPFGVPTAEDGVSVGLAALLVTREHLGNTAMDNVIQQLQAAKRTISCKMSHY